MFWCQHDCWLAPNEEWTVPQNPQKANLWNFSMKMAPSEKNSWITAQECCCFQGLTNSKHPGNMSPHSVHSHSCLQSFKCPDHLVQIITHSDSLSLLFNLFHLHSSPNRALSGRLVIYFQVQKNMIFSKPETESDEVRVSSYVTLCKLDRKQMCAPMHRSGQVDEKLIDQCDKCVTSASHVWASRLQAHTRKIKNIKAQAAGWPCSLYTVEPETAFTHFSTSKTSSQRKRFSCSINSFMKNPSDHTGAGRIVDVESPILGKPHW